MLRARKTTIYCRKVKSLTAFLLLIGSGALPCRAGDWGYDDGPQPDEPTAVVPLKAKAGVLAPASPFGQRPSPPKAQPAKAVPAKAGRPTAPLQKPAPVKAPPSSGDGLSDGASPEDRAVNYWLQLYQVVSEHPFADEQRIEAREWLQARVDKPGPQHDDTVSINLYWKAVSKSANSKPEAEQAYADLFRSLLRYRMRAIQDRIAKEKSVGDSLMSELNTLSAILGPTRMAVIQDSGSLTEDAVNAYADMACMLYSEQNPGKSIDASDNREMFAKVICDKFRDAPSAKDRQGMANFDLIWAKFKVIWEQADAPTRKQMMAKLMSGGAGAAAGLVKDPTLDLVLKNWSAQAR